MSDYSIHARKINHELLASLFKSEDEEIGADTNQLILMELRKIRWELAQIRWGQQALDFRRFMEDLK